MARNLTQVEVEHTSSAREFTALILEVFRFNGRLLSAGDRLSKPQGLTSARWQVIGALQEGPLTVAKIARNMGLVRQSVQRLTNELEKEGIVSYQPNPDHKRAKLVCLTARGDVLRREIALRQVEWANRISADISAHEIQAAASLVGRLRSRLEADRP